MSIISDIMGLFFPRTRYKVGYAKHRGRQDASQELPITETVDSVAERILATEGVADSYPAIPQTKETLAQWLKEKQRLFLGYVSELRNLGEEALSDAMASVHREDARLKARWISMKLRLKDAEEDLRQFDRLYPDYHRGRFIPTFAYILFLVLAAVADLPFNMFAFRIFRETELFTIVVAAVVGTVIPVTAHWIGACLRQPSRNKTDKTLMLATFVLVVVAILGIGMIRESYLKSVGEHSDLVITVLFVFLQYLFFGLATYLAYGAHDMREQITSQLAYYSRSIDQLHTKREKLRERKHNELKETYSHANMLLSKYAEANSNAGGPLSSTGIQDIKLERPKVELKEVDCDMPPEFCSESPVDPETQDDSSVLSETMEVAAE